MNLKSNLVFEKTLSAETELAKLVQLINLRLEKDSILLLSGELGAGKTTTTRHLCEFFGFSFSQSPTYAIHQHHENSRITIDHFDLYRIQGDEDLESTGFWDLLRESKGLIVIEWHERLRDRNWLQVEIKKRKVFGLKIEVHEDLRKFKFFELMNSF